MDARGRCLTQILVPLQNISAQSVISLSLSGIKKLANQTWFFLVFDSGEEFGPELLDRFGLAR